MARGSVYKRCQCRDADGRQIKNCRKDHGSWGFKVDAGEDPGTRKRRQIQQAGFRTRAEAEKALAAVLTDLNRGVWVDDASMTLGDWLTDWLKENEQRRSAKTLANYRGHVRDVWRPRLGHVRLRDLRRAHIEKVLDDLAQPIDAAARPGNVGRRVGRRSAGTIDGYRRTLRAALSAAQRRGLLVVNPAAGRMDAIPPADPRELTIWEPEQLAHFLEYVQEDRLAALFELAGYAGLRRAELCGLRWSDLDPDGAGLVVRQTVVEVASKDLRSSDRACPSCGADHRGLLVKKPKSRAGTRWVPLVQAAQDALKRHRAAQDEERRACGAGYLDHGLVFSRLDGTPLRPGAVTQHFERLVAASGLPTIRLHDTRHGACSLLLSGGVPIEIVQLILGHSSPVVTRQVYAHVMRGATAAQVQAASELVTRHRRDQSVTNQPDEEEDQGLSQKA